MKGVKLNKVEVEGNKETKAVLILNVNVFTATVLT
jgi:hypothetical protein